MRGLLRTERRHRASTATVAAAAAAAAAAAVTAVAAAKAVVAAAVVAAAVAAEVEAAALGELAKDTPVNIVGLLHAVNLNGKEAIIHSYNPTTERYGVVTSSDSETGYNVRRARRHTQSPRG